MSETELEKLSSGVYAITNLVNQKVYVGSARNLVRRWHGHRNQLIGNRHYNRHLQAAWNMYGAGRFRFRILERCPVDSCLVREQFWIDHYRSADRKFGYNGRPRAESNLGKVFGPMSKEHRAKIATGNLGRVFDEETRAKISKSNKGKKHTDATRLKMSLAVRPTGWQHTPETRFKISVTRRTKLASGVLVIRGHPVSQETRAKISAARLGKRLSPEHRLKLSVAKKGKPWSSARRAASVGN